MPDRLPPPQLQGPERLTPKAAPVDTFHRPTPHLLPEGPTQSEQLAQALVQFQPQLNGLMSDVHARNVRQQISEGDAYALSQPQLQNRKALKEAVDRGDIPAARNPWFLRGMQQQVYRIEGEKYDQALREAYSTSDARNTQDISSFVGGFTSKYLDNLGVPPDDKIAAQVLHPAIERSQSNLYASHQAERDQTILQTVKDNTDLEVGLILNRADQDPNANAESYAKEIQSKVQEQFANGLPGADANEIMAKAIATHAEQAGDPGYMDIYDHISSGTGKLGGISWVKKLRDETTDRINSKYLSSQSHQNSLAEAAHKQAKEDFHRDMVKAAETDPNFDVDSWSLKGAAIDGDLATTTRAYWEKKRSDKVAVFEAPAATAGLWSKVYDPTTPLTHKDVVQAATEGKIGGPTAARLQEEIGRLVQYSILDDDVYKMYSTKVVRTIAGSEFVKHTPELDQAAEEGQTIFARQYTGWIEQNPTASFDQKMGIAEGMMNSIVKAQTSDHTVVTDPTREMDSTGDPPQITVAEVLASPVSAFDWNTACPYADQQQFDQAILKLKQSQGKDGTLVRLGQKFGVDPLTLVERWKPLLREKGQAPKK